MKSPEITTDFVRNIESEVLIHLEYINKFVSMCPAAQLAPDYKDAKIIKAMSGSIYPQVFAYLVQNLKRDDAIKKLRAMGKESATLFFSMYKKNLKKKFKFPEIFREIGAHSGERYRIKKLEKKKGVLKKCILQKSHCVFCEGSLKMEDVGVAYCLPSVSFHQHYYNIRSLYLENMKPRLIYVDVAKTAENDSDYCEYHIIPIDQGGI